MKKPILLLMTLILLLSTVPFGAYATSHTVTVADFSMTPSTVPNVVVGDTIHFVWSSGTHTTTSTSVPNGAATWDAPMTSTNTTFNYRVTVAGTYNFVCSFHSNMIGTFTATAGNTGISSLPSQGANLKFYPNPIKSDLNISFNSSVEGEGNIRIYDLTGKEVYRSVADITMGNNSLVMPVGNLTSGMYMAEVIVGTEQIGVRRVIKE